MSWAYGDVIVHREIAWGRPWLAIPERVVDDAPDLLVTYIPTGAPFGYAPGPWPTETGFHPWHPNPAWKGHGALVVQRPDDAYAVWHFWGGDDRRFESWYLNLQSPFRRTAIGYDTQDHELDVIVLPDGQWFFKDDEKMEQRIAEGLYTADEVVEIRARGRALGEMLDAGATWWDPAFTTWSPDPSWSTPALPAGWADVEAT
jgi:hypothetical protein